MYKFIRSYVLYLGRWQLSTPTLWGAIWLLGPGFWPTVIANVIGGLIFYWLDRAIFSTLKDHSS